MKFLLVVLAGTSSVDGSVGFNMVLGIPCNGLTPPPPPAFRSHDLLDIR